VLDFGKLEELLDLDGELLDSGLLDSELLEEEQPT
jgi:hypothetical protein